MKTTKKIIEIERKSRKMLSKKILWILLAAILVSKGECVFFIRLNYDFQLFRSKFEDALCESREKSYIILVLFYVTRLCFIERM